jgi:hypothetical protein
MNMKSLQAVKSRTLKLIDGHNVYTYIGGKKMHSDLGITKIKSFMKHLVLKFNFLLGLIETVILKV